MSQVFEGRFSSNSSSSKSGYFLSNKGVVTFEGQLIETSDRFWFFDEKDQKVYRITKSKRKIVPEKKLHQVTNYDAGKIYFLKKETWIPVDVPKGGLPEVQLILINAKQDYLDLEHSPKDFLVPIRGSDFSEITNPLPLDLVKKNGSANLAYMLIQCQKDESLSTQIRKGKQKYEIVVRVIYKLLLQKEHSLNAISSVSPKLELPLALGTLSHRLYFTDEHGDFKIILPDGVHLVQVSGSSTVHQVGEQNEERGLVCSFQHQPNLNSGKIHLLDYQEGEIHQSTRRIHLENYSELLSLSYLTKGGQKKNAEVLVEYGSLYDRLLTVELVYKAHQVENKRIDCTADLVRLISSYLNLPEKLSFYYLSSHKGFDTKRSEKEQKLIVKMHTSIVSGKVYDLIRKVLIKGTLRPIELRIKVLPNPRK